MYYLLANWCFLYLVQERHFTVLESGWLSSTPPLAAAIGAGVGGQLTMLFSRRYGVHKGLRILPLLSLPAAGLLQFLAVDAVNAYMAVAALALCFFFVEVNRGALLDCDHARGSRSDIAVAAARHFEYGRQPRRRVIAAPIIAYLSGHAMPLDHGLPDRHRDFALLTRSRVVARGDPTRCAAVARRHRQPA